MNEKFLRPVAFILAAILHLFVILFMSFNTERFIQEPAENVRVMKLTDIAEALPSPPVLPLPPPLPFSDLNITRTEEIIAQAMIETDIPPAENTAIAGTAAASTAVDEFLPAHLVSTAPVFNINTINTNLVYPPAALRAQIEGRVTLELLVDRTGTVQHVMIIREEPEGRGFGDAAVRAFTGIRGTPAYVNGVPVSCRYRYPLTFRIR